MWFEIKRSIRSFCVRGRCQRLIMEGMNEDKATRLRKLPNLKVLNPGKTLSRRQCEGIIDRMGPRDQLEWGCKALNACCLGLEFSLAEDSPTAIVVRVSDGVETIERVFGSYIEAKAFVVGVSTLRHFAPRHGTRWTSQHS